MHSLQLRKMIVAIEAHQLALGAIIEQEGGDLVPILQAVQRELGWLPRAVLEQVATRTGIPIARIWGVATFYAGFHLEPRGRTIVRVCQGTACHVRGARRIGDTLARHLGVPAGGGTTADLGHTLERVACLGCCSLAPVIAIDGDIHGKLDQCEALALVARAPGGEDE